MLKFINFDAKIMFFKENLNKIGIKIQNLYIIFFDWFSKINNKSQSYKF
jgi:hypothetical protein